MLRAVSMASMLIISTLSFAQMEEATTSTEGIFATMKTSKGDIEIELYYDKVPLTVASFVGLAEGKLKFDGVKISKPFFDGILFHRVVPGFVIQGGDPEGSGMGGPGYAFHDEFDNSLKHESEGILSMANSGPNTNGSQFFITLNPTPHLDGVHSVFGKVTSGMDVVKSITKGDTILTVEIERVGKAAKKFKPSKVMAAKDKELAEAYEASIAEKWKTAFGKTVEEDNVTIYDGGMMMKTLTEGTGEALDTGVTVQVHYKGMFIDGKVFDESTNRGPLKVTVFQTPVIRGWHEALLRMKKGEKAVVYIPWGWAYGARGRQPMIPPKTDLIFEMEVLDQETSDDHHGHDHNHDGHDHHDHNH